MAYRRGKVLSTDELILGMDEDIEYDEDIGYLYATNNQEGHCVYINFKKLFNRDDVAEYCVFKIHLRKYFKKNQSCLCTRKYSYATGYSFQWKIL